MRGVNFEWIDTVYHATGLQLGFIAQETETVIPEIVSKPASDSTYYGMQYAPITALLVEAIKEQQQIIEQQQMSIDEMKILIVEILAKDNKK